MNSVICNEGDETIQECTFETSQTCGPDQAAGVICNKNNPLGKGRVQNGRKKVCKIPHKGEGLKMGKMWDFPHFFISILNPSTIIPLTVSERSNQIVCWRFDFSLKETLQRREK